MAIKVRFFASLREQTGFDQATLEFDRSLTVEDVWMLVVENMPLPESILFAVNMDYATLDTAVHDNDEVAFFPPVTGG